MWELVFLLLPVSAYSGWLVGKRHTGQRLGRLSLSNDYYTGLNYLLNEQHDKAMDAFMKMLDVSSDSVETTLALGALFRRKGEVDRAIRVHEELSARSTLSRYQRSQSLLELGQDYLYAGVYDRAETLFYEVSHFGGESSEKSQKHLIEIYEREKDWDKAIEVAIAYQATTMAFMGKEIAQYYCEKAILAQVLGDVKSSFKSLKKALMHDRQCVRANLLMGELELHQGHYKSALRALKCVEQQDISFIPEVMAPIIHIHEILALDTALDNYLMHLLRTHPCVSTILAYAKRLEKKNGPDQAARFMAEYLRQYPSIRGLGYLVQFHLKRATGLAKDDLSLLQTLFEKLLTKKPIYQCEKCGFALKSLHWQCPSCRAWACVKPIQGLEGD